MSKDLLIKSLKTCEKYNYHLGNVYSVISFHKNFNNSLGLNSNDAKKLAIECFWKALILGSEQASFCLFQHYYQDSRDDNNASRIAVIMFGISLRFTPNECNKLEKKPEIIFNDASDIIENLINLIKNAYQDISSLESIEKDLSNRIEEFKKVLGIEGDFLKNVLLELRDIYFNHNKLYSNSLGSNDKFDTNKKLIQIDPNVIEQDNSESCTGNCSLYDNFCKQNINNIQVLGGREERGDDSSSSCNIL